MPGRVTHLYFPYANVQMLCCENMLTFGFCIVSCKSLEGLEQCVVLLCQDKLAVTLAAAARSWCGPLRAVQM